MASEEPFSHLCPEFGRTTPKVREEASRLPEPFAAGFANKIMIQRASVPTRDVLETYTDLQGDDGGHGVVGAEGGRYRLILIFK